MMELDRSHRLTFNLLLTVASGGIWPITDWPGATAGTRLIPDHPCHLSLGQNHSPGSRQLADVTDPKATRHENIDSGVHPVRPW